MVAIAFELLEDGFGRKMVRVFARPGAWEPSSDAVFLPLPWGGSVTLIGLPPEAGHIVIDTLVRVGIPLRSRFPRRVRTGARPASARRRASDRRPVRGPLSRLPRGLGRPTA